MALRILPEIQFRKFQTMRSVGQERLPKQRPRDIWFIGSGKQQLEFCIQCACHKTSPVSLLS